MKFRIFAVTAAAAAALAAVFSGCAMESEIRETRIGVVLPLTGENAGPGKRMLAGIRAAAERVNRNGGAAGHPVKLVVVDMRSVYTQIYPAMRDLDARQVKAVLAGYSSTDVLNIGPAAAEFGIPVLLPAASMNELTRNNEYISRLAFTDQAQSKALAYYARFAARFDRMGILINLDEKAVYSRDIGRRTGQEFVQQGGRVVKRAGFREDSADFRPALRQLIQADAEVIVAPASAAAAARIVRQARELGFTGTILGSDSWNEPEFFAAVGPKPGECVFPAQFSAVAATPAQTELAQALRKAPETLTDAEVLGYDAMNVLAAALDSGETGSGLAAMLRKIHRYPGAVGEISIKSDGEAHRRIFLQNIVVRDGKPEPATVLTLDSLRLDRKPLVTELKSE